MTLRQTDHSDLVELIDKLEGHGIIVWNTSQSREDVLRSYIENTLDDDVPPENDQFCCDACHGRFAGKDSVLVGNNYLICAACHKAERWTVYLVRKSTDFSLVVIAKDEADARQLAADTPDGEWDQARSDLEIDDDYAG